MIVESIEPCGKGHTRITLHIPSTGEIRIKTFSNVQIAKRMFQSQLKTWAKRYNEEYDLEVEE